jgi:hypothetical protein
MHDRVIREYIILLQTSHAMRRDDAINGEERFFVCLGLRQQVDEHIRLPAPDGFRDCREEGGAWKRRKIMLMDRIVA